MRGTTKKDRRLKSSVFYNFYAFTPLRFYNHQLKLKIIGQLSNNWQRFLLTLEGISNANNHDNENRQIHQTKNPANGPINVVGNQIADDHEGDADQEQNQTLLGVEFNKFVFFGNATD